MGIELHLADLVTLLEPLHDPAIALLGSLVATSFCGLSLGPPLVEVRSLGEQSLLGLLLGLLHVSLHLLHLPGELGLRGHHLLGAACQLLQGVESTELELQKGLLVTVDGAVGGALGTAGAPGELASVAETSTLGALENAVSASSGA